MNRFIVQRMPALSSPLPAFPPHTGPPRNNHLCRGEPFPFLLHEITSSAEGSFSHSYSTNIITSARGKPLPFLLPFPSGKGQGVRSPVLCSPSYSNRRLLRYSRHL